MTQSLRVIKDNTKFDIQNYEANSASKRVFSKQLNVTHLWSGTKSEEKNESNNAKIEVDTI